MPSFDYDIRFLKAGIDQLENYLLSNTVYWPIRLNSPQGEPPYPNLTVGLLLLSNLRLNSTAHTVSQQKSHNTLENELNQIHDKWIVVWENKSIAEINSRLILWKNFLNEYKNNPQSNYDRYRYEVNRRVLLEILSTNIDKLEFSKLELLDILDKFLQSKLVMGEFIWEDNLKKVFPKQPYWYLYGYLPA